MKKVIITGIQGQDGSYMADYLLENTDHEIYGVVRRASNPNYINIKHILNHPRLQLVMADLSDSPSINKIVRDIKPHYFINFAAQSFVKASWDIPEQTMDINATGVMRCLEAIKEYVPNCRFYNAGSSEQFGDVQYSPQDEKHPFRARSPYGASKIAAHHIVKTYRESYNLYAIQGLLYNHESPRRGEEFVTRKITKGVARIKYALNNNLSFEPIELGNLDAKRDWSDARDFVRGIWMMLNQEDYNNKISELIKEYDRSGKLLLPREVNPTWHRITVKHLKEYVLSSNETHSIREFVELAFKHAGIVTQGHWKGKNENETLHLADYISIPRGALKNSSLLVKINPKFYRPAEVDILLGDSSLVRKELGWKPKYSFNDLVSEMVKNDLTNLEK